MKTLVVTHVYEIALPYLSDMFESLRNQTDSEFDLVVFNYGLSKPLIEFGFFGEEVKNEQGLGIPEARDWAMKYARGYGYDLAIFIDADDVMAADRVEKTKICYLERGDKYGFFYTGLHMLHNKSEDFFKGSLPKSVNDYSIIEETNCIGLSNFAINVNACGSVIDRLNVPEYVVAYDWYFASLLLLNGVKGCFVPSKTYYRIHDLNLAGDTNKYELPTIKRTVSVKSAHYQALMLFLDLEDCKIDANIRSKIKHHAEKYDDLQEKIKNINSADNSIISTHLNPNRSLHWWGTI